MQKRPVLNEKLNSMTFRNFYYLKQELANFCKQKRLPTSGNKQVLTDRIAYFLDTGKSIKLSTTKEKSINVGIITESTIIEQNIICSQKHRAFFNEKIGKSFSFNVLFQKWLKANAGKTYGDAIKAYYQILKEKKQRKNKIDRQFEYNAYIRDFFINNPGKSLHDAIICWNYKKTLPGDHCYNQSDLSVLDR